MHLGIWTLIHVVCGVYISLGLGRRSEDKWVLRRNPKPHNQSFNPATFPNLQSVSSLLLEFSYIYVFIYLNISDKAFACRAYLKARKISATKTKKYLRGCYFRTDGSKSVRNQRFPARNPPTFSTAVGWLYCTALWLDDWLLSINKTSSYQPRDELYSNFWQFAAFSTVTSSGSAPLSDAGVDDAHPKRYVNLNPTIVFPSQP
jgi:hypothetical protein